MSFDDISEAAEATVNKEKALIAFADQVQKSESMGIIYMYERAARDLGATDKEIVNARKGLLEQDRSKRLKKS